LSSGLVAGEELQVLRDDAVISNTARITGTGWTFTDERLPDGNYDYTVRIVDAAGNIGRESGVYDVRIAGTFLLAVEDPASPDAAVAEALSFDDLLATTTADVAAASPPAFVSDPAADPGVAALPAAWMARGIDSLVDADVIA
jgi:hypothetical protein